jgi:hypothetical protein
MNAPFKSLANPLMRNVGPATPRVPEPFIELDLPADTVIVSSDGHWELDGDIFLDAFPAHLKEEAPRVWFDQFIRVGYQGKMETYPTTDAVVRGVQLNIGPGASDIDIRLAHLAAEGIKKEILFPQSILSFVRHPNLEVMETIFRVYNAYIAEVSARQPGVFFGVGVFSNWWDPARAEAAMQQTHQSGPVGRRWQADQLQRREHGPLLGCRCRSGIAIEFPCRRRCRHLTAGRNCDTGDDFARAIPPAFGPAHFRRRV